MAEIIGPFINKVLHKYIYNFFFISILFHFTISVTATKLPLMKLNISCRFFTLKAYQKQRDYAHWADDF